MNTVEIKEMVAAEHGFSKMKTKQIVEQVFGVVGSTLKKAISLSEPMLDWLRSMPPTRSHAPSFWR
ncbi:hypothetical protein E4K72_05925 [Oxalobacteraceae bacterium OM1]|nr:hypothetical protein E4K72_05925 [Oxalobacteraceae bacterium OM1]